MDNYNNITEILNRYHRWCGGGKNKIFMGVSKFDHDTASSALVSCLNALKPYSLKSFDPDNAPGNMESANNSVYGLAEMQH